MAKRSSVGPTLTVFGVWWVSTAYFAPTYDWQSMVSTFGLVTFGLLLGVIAAVVAIAVIRTGQRTIVAPTELRGLRCSIGEVPMPMPAPEQSESLPSISPVTMPDVPADFVDNWLDEYASEYPEHAELFKALLRVLNHRPDLPATHVEGGHGGRTLLQHSMLTAWIMTEVSRTWAYDGLRDRTGKRVVIPLRDADYSFKPHDPMVAIIGLAHDIGKIESYIYNDQGAVVGIRAEHDLTGSRMIARMPESWDIPSEDRDAMLLAIAHYHHPVELPLVPDQRKAVARDDRTIALMELLIRADFTVTRVETQGEVPSDEDYRSLDAVRTAGPEQIYDEFISLIHEAHRINSGNVKYSIGQISPSPDGEGALLYLHEESLRINMMRRLGLQDQEPLGDGRYQITIDLLNVLKARGMLYTVHEGMEYSAGQSMWVCDVIGSKQQRVAGWPCAIAVKLEQFERLQQLGFFSSSIKILRNRFGAHLGKPVRSLPAETKITGNLGSNNDIPDAPTPKKKAKPGKPGKPAQQVEEQKVSHPDQAGLPPVQAVVPENDKELAPISAEPDGRIEPVLDVPIAAIEEAAKQEDVQEAVQPAAAEVEVVAVKDEAKKGVPPVASDNVAEKPPAEAPQTQETRGASVETKPEKKARQVSPLAAPRSDAGILKEKFMAATTCGISDQIKCRKGSNGNLVFNLKDLLSEGSPVARELSDPEILAYIEQGNIPGVSMMRMNPTLTLISVTVPALQEA